MQKVKVMTLVYSIIYFCYQGYISIISVPVNNSIVKADHLKQYVWKSVQRSIRAAETGEKENERDKAALFLHPWVSVRESCWQIKEEERRASRKMFLGHISLFQVYLFQTASFFFF